MENKIDNIFEAIWTEVRKSHENKREEFKNITHQGLEFDEKVIAWKDAINQFPVIAEDLTRCLNEYKHDTVYQACNNEFGEYWLSVETLKKRTRAELDLLNLSGTLYRYTIDELISLLKPY